MKIKSVKIKNYHSIVECDFTFSNLLALIGENNSGKSNIIHALKLFFSKEKPRDVFSFNDSSKPIEIIIEFEKVTNYERNKIQGVDGDSFTLKKSYKYNSETNKAEFDCVDLIKNDDVIPLAPRIQNILSDTLPDFFLLPAVKYCSEEIKISKSKTTSNFNKFLNLVLKEFEGDFQDWDELLRQLNKETQKKDESAPLIKIAQEISLVLKEQLSDADVELKPRNMSRADIFENLEVFLDDDHNLPLLTKGQGTQRAFIFAILRVFANKLNEERPVNSKDKKNIIIAIEEPELFLHPPQQKIIYNLLKRLSEQAQEQVQILYSTHSSFMVHIEDYKYVGIVKKPSVAIGTKIFQHTNDIFPGGEDKKEFRLLCEFDPERNELFFAKKIIFVEGSTEKVSLPAILNMININPVAGGISIIECGGRGGIKLFVNVVNAFNMTNYLVMYDKDSGEIAERENEELAKICRKDSTYPFNPKFTKELKLKNDSPYLARREILDKKITIPSNLKEFLIKNL